ncbi:DUF721 domain-containing protein [Pleomorphomonas sp. JP5]|uniref:DUF721 domain-containing protein n=1 Tax=Pleomorphomonas sp. JP5 TaxID=2942998 RepID=UPI002043739A|nr:DciA family protein [Pleomorphomonas sp. JP5]MCM5558724.1 DciA family protein [Pleomorphomonas sp. JP5]
MARLRKPAFVYKGVRPLADIIAAPLNAACRKRGFATLDLVAHWPDIVGPAYAETTAPDQLSWPRRPKGLIDEEDHEPAVLTVRCSGAAAMRLSLEAPQLIERINTFFGYRLVGRLKPLQLPPVKIGPPPRPKLAKLSPEAEARVRTLASGISDDGLKAAVERLGRAISGDSRARR